jgi:hypothetical protein
MKLFLIVNLLLIDLYILWVFILCRISFEWRRTFWKKRIYGLNIWWWNKKHTVGNTIFQWGFYSYEQIEEMDHRDYKEMHSMQNE